MTALSLPFLPPMSSAEPLDLSRGILGVVGTEVTVTGRQHVPSSAPMIVVSNHRSPLDPPVLMTGVGREIAFACHQYMANVPVLRDLIDQFGAFPLKTPRDFFRKGFCQLRRRGAIGVFPEGAQPMVTLQPPRLMNSFHRGFAHLALRAPVNSLALLPVALVSDEEGFESPIPLKLLSWFDPSEPLFQQSGGHPIVFYRRVEVRIGEPIWITPQDRQSYRGRRGSDRAQSITNDCWTAVNELLHQ